MGLKDRKTKIKFYAGMKTIGGTYIEIKYENYRIIFDCGSIYDPNIDENDLDFRDIINSQLAPDIEGLFDSRITKSDKKINTSVFVSHAHLDHTKMINYVDNNIPIYTSNDTKKLLYALNINNDFIFKNKLNEYSTREIIGLDYNESINIGNINVRLIRVDHDAYGSCGFIINTPDMKIAYTGDIRLHGYLKDESLNFINEAQNSDLLIIEGVSVSFMDFEEEYDEDKLLSERSLINKLQSILNENPDKQITFDYYVANIERIINIIKYSNRIVVLDEFHSYVLKMLTGNNTHYYSNTNNKYGLDHNYQIEYDELLNDKGKFLWQFTKRDKDSISKLDQNCLYLHCDAQPLGDFDPLYFPFIKKLNERNIIFIPLNCSGHAHPNDLVKIINSIKPKILTPIHSFRPEMLYNNFGETILPQKNETL